jgi:HAD superfamily hydrolase (TIGR01509 family)
VQFIAAFFDRDGTLSHQNPEIVAERDKAISEIAGRSITIDEDLNRDAFYDVWKFYPSLKPVRDIDTENEFWKKWFEQVLLRLGVNTNIQNHAESLFRKYTFYRMMKLYPETLSVLDYFQETGLKLGVISDTFPSLEMTLELLGIRKYFQNVTASSLVGAGKPDPRIFNYALNDIGVTAPQSLFVDDTEEEASGARELGFTSFYLDREEEKNKEWTINSLSQFMEYHRMAI